MAFINLDVNHTQQLISYNKKQIRELQTEADCLEYLIAVKYWPNSNPSDFGCISQKSYEMLNRAKGDLAGVKKKLKMLTELQYQLKKSIR